MDQYCAQVSGVDLSREVYMISSFISSELKRLMHLPWRRCVFEPCSQV